MCCRAPTEGTFLWKDDPLDFELDVFADADADHRRATVIGQVQSKGLKHAINDNQSLPTKERTMTDTFQRALR